MITKELLDKCLKYLYKELFYDNVSYGIVNYKTFIFVTVYIWDKVIDYDTLLKSFTYNLVNKDDFNNMTKKIKDFINNNKQLLCLNLEIQ